MISISLRTIILLIGGMYFVPQVFAQQADLRYTFQNLDNKALALHEQEIKDVNPSIELLESVIDLSLTNIGIEEALKHVADKMKLKLMYSKKMLPQEKKVTIHSNAMNLYDVMWTLLEGTDLQFAISQNRQLILLQRQNTVSSDEVLQESVSGRVTDANTGEALPGVNVYIEGTQIGTSTDFEGQFELTVPDQDAVFVFTFIGYDRSEIPLDGRAELSIELTPQIIAGDELVVVGYGVQRRSDITGSVASVPRERMEMLPNQNVAQAIQGAVPGVMIQTTSAGATPNETLMVRGRNSITASNTPLIVVDGVPYAGGLSDVNPNDIESIEVLKDASAAAIYGSRGSNGVILITTQRGASGVPRIAYESRASTQSYAKLPNMMSGEEFYHFKMERFPGAMTQSEQDIYNSGEWVDWFDLGFRTGMSHEHNLSVSGGTDNHSYYISGGFLDVKGIAVNDYYQRLTGRVNVDTEIAGWLSIGTRTNLSYGDQSGVPVQVSGSNGIYRTNPLVRPYDEDGNLSIYPWVEDQSFANPLASTLYDDQNHTYQIVTNNFANIEVPFVTGLNNRINVGIRSRYNSHNTYRGRNTKDGLENRGIANKRRNVASDLTFENITSFNRDFGVHNIFVTGVFSYEENSRNGESLQASGFQSDLLTWYGVDQAETINNSVSFNETYLISQMLRLNYSFNQRYILTLTGRRDGFSGFGSDNKWGFFPSVAVAWNAASEEFFPWQHIFNEFKPKFSWGFNGNQAVGAYSSMTRLGGKNTVAHKNTQPGFIPTRLGQPDLGWEASNTINIGLDIALFGGRISGDVNYYNTNTQDLLLNRTISSVHGISSIVQNIGETQNRGFEMSVHSYNINSENFMWTTTGNISLNKNKILDLYGDGRDDVANGWFIGHPINVNYDYVWEGTWQLDEADEAAQWGSKPGYVKLKDFNNDGQLTASDRQIIGQNDPSVLWGLSNTFSYKNFNLNVFIHGVHGVTRANPLMTDYTWADVRINTTRKNWWTPENATNEWVINELLAQQQSGIEASYYEDASFIRIKDISFSYDLPQSTIRQIGLERLRLYVTGSNLYTFTKWSGLDPELSGQYEVPLQQEFSIGINVGF